ncbi:MAG: TIGR03668 family PPOX class F420-dependent oxidoreductase [Chloroflexi bacterium]|nr:TIGR03668 family PPOX class F420-dependent oxidoreductase [Chloroflexota bacterium]MBV9543080.1 TIGR03668 family PPOX class F420-dependent oxidoreductase [Chloroflexota bacterium]
MLLDDRAQAFIGRQRVAHMATASATGVPHVVPVCCVLIDRTVYVAIDEKPKQGDPRALRRVKNIAENSRVAIVFDEYDDADWSRLGFVLLHCEARLVDDTDERKRALAGLRAKYPQYRTMLLEQRPLIAADIQRATAWGTAAAYS